MSFFFRAASGLVQKLTGTVIPPTFDAVLEADGVTAVLEADGSTEVVEPSTVGGGVPELPDEPPEPTAVAGWGTAGTLNVSPGVTSATINAAAAGWTIQFAAGTYTGLVIVPKNKQRYRGDPANPGSVILDGGGADLKAFNGGSDLNTFLTGTQQVWLSGLTIQHYAITLETNLATGTYVGVQNGDGQVALAVYRPGPFWVLEDCIFRENYGRAVDIGTSMRIRRCVAHDNGVCGFAGRPARGLCIIEDCDIYANCRYRMAPHWESGGVKWVGGSNQGAGQLAGPLAVRRTKLHGNYGPGIWADYNCVFGYIYNCSIHGNAFNGIQLEVSARWHIHHNQIGDNMTPTSFWATITSWGLFDSDVMFQNTKKCTFEHNLLVSTRLTPIFIGQQGRGNGAVPPDDVYPMGDRHVGFSSAHQNIIRNNTFVMINNGSFRHLNGPGAAPFWFIAGVAISTNINCATDIAPDHDPADDLDWDSGNDFCYVAQPAAGTNELSTTFNANTFRIASGSPSIPAEYGATNNMVLGNPSSYVPDWTVIPTWTTPPGYSGSAEPTAGLIAHWRFESNVTDAQGTYNGTVQGTPTYEAGHVGTAIRLDGTSQYVTFGDFAALIGNDHSYAGWIWFDGTSGQRGIVSKHSGVSVGILIEQSGTAVRAYIQSNTPQVTDADFVTAGQWLHLAVVVATGTVTIYRNGVVAATGTYPTAPTSPAGQLFQLGKQNTAARFHAGMLDDWRVYNVSLSATDVAAQAAM